MKLYYSPGACSLAPHIAMRELGIPVDLMKVDLKAKQYDGGDYKQINGKGYVPAVETPAGVLTEAPVILQYLADQKPDAGLAPSPAIRRATGSRRCSTSSLPKCTGHGQLLNPALTEEWRKAVTDRWACASTGWRALEGKQYIMGDKFSGRRRLPVHHPQLGGAEQVPHALVHFGSDEVGILLER